MKKTTKKLAKNILSTFVFVVFILLELTIFVVKPFDKLNKEDKLLFETAENSHIATKSEMLYEYIPKETVNYGIPDKIIVKVLPDVKYATVSDAYFKNTLFIGDSRMVGFKVYKELDGATYFADSSYGLYDKQDKKLSVKGYGEISLPDLLSKVKFDKIYISLGINNLGASPIGHKEKLRNYLNMIISKQPKVLIYLVANFHVTAAQDVDDRVNNENVNAVNELVLKPMADNVKIFYLDPNYLYDDVLGYLDQQYSFDNIHIRSKFFDKYLEFLKTHAVVDSK